MIINFCIDIYELINNIMLTNKVNYYYPYYFLIDIFYKKIKGNFINFDKLQ